MGHSYPNVGKQPSQELRKIEEKIGGAHKKEFPITGNRLLVPVKSMVEESDARNQILERIEPGPVAWLPIHLAAGRPLARDLFSIADFPEFDNSSMDGYAVRASEAARGAVLKVFPNEQAAGIDRNLTLEEGTAIRIFTGAPIPQDADAVIMQEDVERNGDEIRILEGVVSGENIRRRGGDLCAGQKMLSRGDVLNPARLGLLASQGMAEAPVHLAPMVHVVTTGDELVHVGEYRLPGQIYNSNALLLKSAVEELGAQSDHVHLPDSPQLMKSELEKLCESSDFLVIAGGISVGDHDYVKEVLAEIGVKTEFWKVRIKPGKPFLFGLHPNGCAVFGLPGNPVSAFVTFHLFVAPALRRRMGIGAAQKDASREGIETFLISLGCLDEDLENQGDRPHYFRGIAENGTVKLSGTQQSHAVFGLSKSNCLIRTGAGEKLAKGEEVIGIWVS